MKFEKVSFETFVNALPSDLDISPEEKRRIYDNIKLPRRSTEKSAAYDFFSPVSGSLLPLETTPYRAFRDEVLIPTGIKAQLDPGWVLTLYPRSGQGFKYGIALANTVGIIDEDYYNNETNEGHIMLKLTTTSTRCGAFQIKEGMAVCQGMLLPYGLTDDDAEYEKKKRTGGLGSTGGI